MNTNDSSSIYNYTTITSAGEFNLPRVEMSSQFTSLKIA